MLPKRSNHYAWALIMGGIATLSALFVFDSARKIASGWEAPAWLYPSGATTAIQCMWIALYGFVLVASLSAAIDEVRAIICKRRAP